MFLEQKALLTPIDVSRLVALAQALPFVEGRLSNPHNTTKLNLQADIRDDRCAESARIVANALSRSRSFQDFAQPKLVAPPLLARYEPGMKYGPHADVAFMSVAMNDVPQRLRSDLSCTVFLNDPESYDGGELALYLGAKPLLIKGAPGDAFIYPSTFLHEVRPVTRGQRLVSITFIESWVPDEWKRTTLFELRDVLALEAVKMHWASRVRMEVALQNLTRQWSQS